MSVASVGTGINPSIPMDFPYATRGGTAQKPQVSKSVASDMERISQVFNKKLQYVVDHNSNEVIVKVIDSTTDKVIKVIPPEELQRLHSKLKETIGFLFDERV